MKFLSALMVAALLLIQSVAPVWAIEDFWFSDVPADYIYYDAVEYVYEEGIVQGYPDGTYRPDQPINRAEFVKILMLSQYSEEEIQACLGNDTTDPFLDVPRAQWFASFVCMAKDLGIIGGYPDGSFQAGREINFVESSKVTVLTYGLDYQATDVWYEGYVRALDDRNAIPQTIDSFEHLLTRGEMAEIIYRLDNAITDKESPSYEELAGQESEPVETPEEEDQVSDPNSKIDLSAYFYDIVVDGDKKYFRFEMKNEGTEDAIFEADEVVMVIDYGYDDGTTKSYDYFLDGIDPSFLEAGGSWIVTIQSFIYEGLETVAFQLDPNHLTAEFEEQNNEVWANVVEDTYVEGEGDIQSYEIETQQDQTETAVGVEGQEVVVSFYDFVYDGDKQYVRFEFINEGTESISFDEDDTVMSISYGYQDGSVQTYNNDLNNVNPGFLEVGGSWLVTVSAYAYPDLETLELCFDPDDLIDEVEETNNCVWANVLDETYIEGEGEVQAFDSGEEDQPENEEEDELLNVEGQEVVVSFYDFVYDGDKQYVRFEFINEGTESISFDEDDTVMSISYGYQDGSVQTYNNDLNNVNPGFLEVGGSWLVTVSAYAYPDLETLELCFDPDDLIDEVEESNNCVWANVLDETYIEGDGEVESFQ